MGKGRFFEGVGEDSISVVIPYSIDGDNQGRRVLTSTVILYKSVEPSFTPTRAIGRVRVFSDKSGHVVCRQKIYVDSRGYLRILSPIGENEKVRKT